MVTSLVNPAVKDAEEEPNVDAPRPRREPRPSKKKLEELENTQQCKAPKRKKPETEKGHILKEHSSKQKQMNKEPEVSQKKKSASKKRKAADPKDTCTQDSGLISAANTQRVQNLLERRQHASWKPEVVEIEEGEEENRTNQPSNSVQPKSKPQPSGIHLHVSSAVPVEPVQISSKPRPLPINVVKSTNSVSNSRSQSADTFQQRDIPSLLHQLSAERQSNGSESTFFPPQQSSNLSIATHPPSSSHYKSASPVNPASKFQFSSTPVRSPHSALRGPSPSHFSMSSLQQLMNSSEVLSSPVIPQQEFSISQSLSHCSDYDVSDLEEPVICSSRNSNLHQLQTAQSHTSRDDSWHRKSSFSADLNNSCPNCQPLLQSLSSRLSSLEAEVEKLRRKQRKVWKSIISVKDVLLF